jgi:hypothetical protein
MPVVKEALAATLCAIAAVVCLYPYASMAAAPQSPQPVMIGGEESSEGCAGTATVAVRAGSTLNLRSGPGTSYGPVARLSPGQAVSICQSPGNGWVGVVVHGRGRLADCGLSDAGPKAKPYTGPCDSGWVKEEFLRLQAG